MSDEKKNGVPAMPNAQLLFGVFVGTNGLDIKTSMKARDALRMLVSVLEDVRERALKESIDDAKMVHVFGAAPGLKAKP